MESQNRPYIDPDMEPGDAGTEEWADDVPAGGAADRGPLADGGSEHDVEGALTGSPADIFDDGDAVANSID